MSIDWNTTAEEREIIGKIAERAVDIAPSTDPVTIEMDIVACHKNGTPLDLAGLLAADQFTFLHDVAGINKHINHSTGQLENHFLPRCALPKETSDIY